MKYGRRQAVIAFAAALGACVLPGGPDPADTPVPVDLDVTLEGPHPETDRVVAARDGRLLVIDIFSGTGIGRARIARPQGGWPARIQFRLHLRALEGFTVTGAHRFEVAGLLPDNEGAPIAVELPPGIAVGELAVSWVDRYR